MASISLMICGNADASTFFNLDGSGILGLSFSYDLPGGIPYERSDVNLHGSLEDMQRLASRIYDAVNSAKEQREAKAGVAITAEGVDAAGMNE